jgi:hypothetical protein
LLSLHWQLLWLLLLMMMGLLPWHVQLEHHKVVTVTVTDDG